MRNRAIVVLLATAAILALLWAAGGAIASPPRDEPARDEVSVAGTVASKFSYQGRVTGAGGNPLDGIYGMQFRLYDAETEGSMVWDSGAQDVTVEDGLFSVELAVDRSVFNGQAMWLEVEVAGEALPRQEILPVPYALSLVSGAVISGASESALLTVTNPDGPAIVATDGETTEGQSHGENSSDLARALADDESGGPVVAYNSGASAAVYGNNTGSGTGVSGWANAEGAIGVKGGSMNGIGVGGESVHSTGVKGESEYGIGGYFKSNGDAGLYVDGGNALYAASFEGDVIIEEGDLTLKGKLLAAAGKVEIDTDGEIYAKSFHTVDSGGSTTSGVTTEGYASYKSVSSSEGVSVPRTGSGKVSMDNGGFSIDPENPMDPVSGFWDAITAAFYTSGDHTVGGTKSAVVSTVEYGKRKLYAEEAAEVFFFDRGQGQIVNGQVNIVLEPMFLETVTIDVGHPMLVQITLTADCNGVFIAEQTATSFTVKELMGGTSDATFNWEVAAKRKGYEDARLEPFAPETP